MNALQPCNRRTTRAHCAFGAAHGVIHFLHGQMRNVSGNAKDIDHTSIRDDINTQANAEKQAFSCHIPAMTPLTLSSISSTDSDAIGSENNMNRRHRHKHENRHNRKDLTNSQFSDLGEWQAYPQHAVGRSNEFEGKFEFVPSSVCGGIGGSRAIRSRHKEVLPENLRCEPHPTLTSWYLEMPSRHSISICSEHPGGGGHAAIHVHCCPTSLDT